MTVLQHTAPPVARSRRSLVAASVCVGLALLVTLLNGVEPSMLGLYVTVTLLGIACVLPLWMQFFRGTLDYFEIIHPFGFIYFLNFGAASIWVMHDPQLAYDMHLIPYIPKAALYALLGYLAFLVGYYGPLSKNLGESSTRRYWTLNGNGFLICLGGVGLVGYLVWADVMRTRYIGGSALTGLSSFLGQISFVFIVVWGMANLLLWAGKATRAQKFIFLTFLVPASFLIARAYVSRKQLVLTLFLIPVVAYWYTRRKVPWVTLITLFLLFVFVVFPIYNAVRHFDWADSIDARLSMTFDTMRDWDGDEYMDKSLGSFKGRLALINSTAVALRDCPRWVPYEGGGEYLMAPAIILIPRFLWPDKPGLGKGREFGVQFRVINPLDEFTHIAPSLPGELYWQFDLPGILIGMGLIGFGLRWIYGRYGGRSPAISIDRAIYILLLMRLMVIEGALLAQLAGLLKVLLVLVLIEWGARKIGWLKPIESGPAA